MSKFTGGFDINTLLAVQTGSVLEYGLDRVTEIILGETTAHNALTMEALSALAEPVVEREGAWGSTIRGDMIEVGEYGKASTQNQGMPGDVAWPLRKFHFNVGWTNDFMMQASPADLARIFQTRASRDVINIRRLLAEALFTASNRTVRDVFVDNKSLTVRALVNADGEPIPDGPNGETFDPDTHTHYNVTTGATLAATDVDALIKNVVEHGHSAGLVIYINQAQENAVRNLDGFAPYVDSRIITARDETVGRAPLDTTRIDNRAIGLIGGAEVHVKPWVPANYLFATASGDSAKPLRMRQHNVPAMQGLRIAATMPDYPLFAEVMENYYGFGAWERTNGAVLQITSDGTYTSPSF